jgi:hypothetical protein
LPAAIHSALHHVKEYIWIAFGDPLRFALPKGLAAASLLRLFYLSA